VKARCRIRAAVNSREFQDRLVQRATRAGIVLPPSLVTKLETYYRLLSAWNEKINLTGMNLAEPGPEALDRLLIEPIVAAQHVPGGSVRQIDIGSGGGSPAIPFALAAPGLRLRMVESKTRKSVFLREVVRALDMDTAEVITSRFEALLARPDLHEGHDLLTIRAVRVEPLVLETLQAFLRPGGFIFLFRSGNADLPEIATRVLTPRGTHALVESLVSRLVVLQKQ
jgi:16S rRNA (guanine527-N7)-methyltransferase